MKHTVKDIKIHVFNWVNDHQAFLFMILMSLLSALSIAKGTPNYIRVIAAICFTIVSLLFWVWTED